MFIFSKTSLNENSQTGFKFQVIKGFLKVNHTDG